MSISDRVTRVAAAIESLEQGLELLCVTGVEDRLQDNVRNTLETLRNGGIKVWCHSMIKFLFGSNNS